MSDHHHFNYIELPTTNMAAMKAFYADVFGWGYVDYGPGYAAITGAGMDGGFDANAGARKPSAEMSSLFGQSCRNNGSNKFHHDE